MKRDLAGRVRQPVHRASEEPEQALQAGDGHSITFDHGTEFVSWPHLQA